MGIDSADTSPSPNGEIRMDKSHLLPNNPARHWYRYISVPIEAALSYIYLSKDLKISSPKIVLSVNQFKELRTTGHFSTEGLQRYHQSLRATHLGMQEYQRSSHTGLPRLHRMDTVPAYVDWRACTATSQSGVS
jgi:hypothetical protein